MSINIKTQTRRSTNWKEKITNINVFYKDFELGVITSKDWGDFGDREIPIITLAIEGKEYQIPLDVFVKGIKKTFGRLKPRDLRAGE